MKCYQDLREFIAVLAQQGQLLLIIDEVRFEPDLAASACALAQIGTGAQSFWSTRSQGAPTLGLR